MAKIRLTKDERHVLTVLSRHSKLNSAGMRNETGHINATSTGDKLVKKGLATKSGRGRSVSYEVTDLGREVIGG